MGKYIAKRILWLIPVIVGVTFLIFTIMFFIPGDPVAIMLGSSATQAEIEQAREMLLKRLVSPPVLELRQRSIFTL